MEYELTKEDVLKLIEDTLPDADFRLVTGKVSIEGLKEEFIEISWKID